MGQIRKIQKTQKRKGTDQENSQKKQEGKNEGKKKKRRVPYSCVLERPWATALVQLSLRRTHSNGNLPYKQKAKAWDICNIHK
jgi:hypothetical protein